MEGYNPWGPVLRHESPGEMAQKWASIATMGLKLYLDVSLTAKETDALAIILAKFIVETKKKSGVDLTQME